MNKKLLIGFAALLTAGAFWACGEGSIESINEDDGFVDAMAGQGGIFPTDPSAISQKVKQAKDECAANVACYAEMQKNGGYVEPEPESSQSVGPTPSVTSSSGGLLPPIANSSNSVASSSTIIIIDPISSSSLAPVSQGAITPTSSAAPQPADGEIATCYASTNPINKMDSTSWKVKMATPTQAMNAAYSWSFVDADASQSTDNGSGATGVTSKAITYTASGQKTATVDITLNGQIYNVVCDPLQVNGAAITGCECNSVSAPDIAGDPTAVWTVDGCSSPGANIIAFAWEGATDDGSGTAASFTFTKKGETAAPVVTVANDDNTLQKFQCNEIKAVDANAPDFLLDSANKIIELPMGEVTITTAFDPSWHNNETAGNCHLQCDAKEGNASLAGAKVNGTAVTGVNGNNFQTAIPIASTINSKILLSLPADSKCKVFW